MISYLSKISSWKKARLADLLFMPIVLVYLGVFYFLVEHDIDPSRIDKIVSMDGSKIDESLLESNPSCDTVSNIIASYIEQLKKREVQKYFLKIILFRQARKTYSDEFLYGKVIKYNIETHYPYDIGSYQKLIMAPEL